MRWDRRDIESFFGCTLRPGITHDGSSPKIWFADYRGRLLQYQMMIDEADGCVAIAGDDETPFGSDSIFEASLPCTEIKVCKDPYREGTGLRCFYGDPEVRGTMVLTILKRPDGDLKVWPTTSPVVMPRHLDRTEPGDAEK